MSTTARSILRRVHPRQVVILIGVIGVAIVGQLLLSIGLADGSYQIESLTQQKKQLTREVQQVSEEISTLNSPQSLAERGTQMGMEPSSQVTFLSLTKMAAIGTVDSKGVQVKSGEGSVSNVLLQQLNESGSTTEDAAADSTAEASDELQASGGSAVDPADATVDSTTGDTSAQDDSGRSLPEVSLR